MNGAFQPPAAGATILSAVIADRDLRESAIGDLAEDFHLAAERTSIHSATLWYWWQIVRSIVPLSRLAMASGGHGWRRLVAALIAGYATLAICVMSTDLLLGLVIPYGPGDWRMPIASLVAGGACAVAAGYVSAVVCRSAPFAAALALGGASAALTVLMVLSGGDGTPLWYQIGLLTTVAPSTVAGALIRVRRVERPTARPRPEPSQL